MTPVDSSTSILTLSNTQAKELAGKVVTIGMETYYFKNYDPKYPGQPPWRSGGEGKAFPLLGYDQSVVAYLKFFTRPTQKRLDRTAWLIGQQIHTWLPCLAAAPLVWGDTRHANRPVTTTLDFAGYLAKAVPGKTWLELKNSIHDNSVPFPEDFRWRCVLDLVLALSVLEQEGIVHGDLSPNNIVIDLEARPDQPALYLIDFDAFVALAAEGNEVVTVAEGGTYGTEGYCPPDLAAAATAGDGSVAPYSDRYGRDMLLVELLIMDCGLSPDDPPSVWSNDHLQRRYAAWQARSDPGCFRTLSHLEPTTLFALSEQDRPASTALAAGLGLSPPTKQVRRRMTRVRSLTPVVLGHSLATAGIKRATQRSAATGSQGIPATLRFLVPWRWSRPEAYPGYRTLWGDIRVATGCVTILLMPVILGLIIILLKTIFDLLEHALH
jgi:serine/threonine protein kinase